LEQVTKIGRFSRVS